MKQASKAGHGSRSVWYTVVVAESEVAIDRNARARALFEATNGPGNFLIVHLEYIASSSY